MKKLMIEMKNGNVNKTVVINGAIICGRVHLLTELPFAVIGFLMDNPELTVRAVDLNGYIAVTDGDELLEQSKEIANARYAG